ncbi:hypothetical protein [Streptomyces sp. NPDC093990]
METSTSTREVIPAAHRHPGGTARPPAVIAGAAARLARKAARA